MKNDELVKKIFDADEISDVKEITSHSIVLEVGNGIRGMFKGIVDDTDNKGREIKLLVLDTNNMGLIDMAIPTTLMRTVKNFEIDDDVGILRIDDGMTKDNTPFKQFRVFCKSK